MSHRPSLFYNHNKTGSKHLFLFIIMRLRPKCFKEVVLSYNHNETKSKCLKKAH